MGERMATGQQWRGRAFRRVAPVMLGLAAGALFASFAFSGAALASQRERPRAVLELFTSQGCSSCPAADALFVELAKDPSLIVLTLPVDYWDYLGWRDTLADAAFSMRQRRYARKRSDGHVYTPQAVIDGERHAVGSDREAIMQAVRARGIEALPLSVKVEETAEHIRVAVEPQGVAAGGGSIWLVPLARHRSVKVMRGENKGREMAYANVARGLMRVADWNGQATTLELPASLARHPEADAYVVLVHADDGRIGRIIGAGRGPGF
jgi:hypothetical protein